MYENMNQIYEAVMTYEKGMGEAELLVQSALGCRVNFKHEFTIKELFAMDMIQLSALGLTKTQQIKIRSIQRLFSVNTQFPEYYKVRSPQDAAKYMIPKLSNLTQEHLVVAYLSVKNQIIKEKTIYIGGLNSSIVHPREIYKEAFLCSAAAIICFHNHPSGDTTPSPEDIAATKRLAEVGDTMGIDMLDHIIIAGGKYLSLKDKGYMQ